MFFVFIVEREYLRDKVAMIQTMQTDIVWHVQEKGGVSKMKEVRFAQKSFKSIKNLSFCISTP